ncbi:MAG: type II toxin-antitoxin system death-on-curing family toxin [Burkholderiaceae bacterium]
MDYAWIGQPLVEAIHDAQLAEHGGSIGVRDEELLVSALAKPLNLVAYGQPDFADCAAAYACGIARNHLFLDGDKRTAFVVMVLFLERNGHAFGANEAESVVVMLGVADGTIDAVTLARWIRNQVAVRTASPCAS